MNLLSYIINFFKKILNYCHSHKQTIICNSPSIIYKFKKKMRNLDFLYKSIIWLSIWLNIIIILAYKILLIFKYNLMINLLKNKNYFILIFYLFRKYYLYKYHTLINNLFLIVYYPIYFNNTDLYSKKFVVLLKLVIGNLFTRKN